MNRDLPKYVKICRSYVEMCIHVYRDLLTFTAPLYVVAFRVRRHQEDNFLYSPLCVQAALENHITAVRILAHWFCFQIIAD